MDILPVILAGGYGTRLKPLSTNVMPKQFISFFTNGDSLFQSTVRRIRNSFATQRIFILCNKNHLQLIKNQLSSINEDNYIIIAEYEKYNTCIPILYLVKYIINNKIKVDTLFVSPSDSCIRNTTAFSYDLYNSCLASYLLNKHILFGIKPNKINTNYGYIKVVRNKKCFSKIKSFIEKPNNDTARMLLYNNDCYWNSGSFIFNFKILLNDICKYQNDLFNVVKNSDFINLEDNVYVFSGKNIEEKMELPIDKAIIEKSNNLICCKATFDWCDAGTWDNFIQLYNNKSIVLTDKMINCYKQVVKIRKD